MKNRMISAVCALAMAAAIPLTASAEKVQVDARINVVGRSATIKQESTLYVGEVVVDGETAFTYIYSEDITWSKTSFDMLRDGFKAMDNDSFSQLIPELTEEEEGKGAAVCSIPEYTADIDDNWKTASFAGMKYYEDFTSMSVDWVELYGNDESFAKACAFKEDTEIFNADGSPAEQYAPFGILTQVNSDNVTYTVEDGKLVKLVDREIDYGVEAIKVIYTKAEVSTKTLKGDVTGDNKVDTKDAMKVISFAKKTTTPKNDTEFKAADVNNDDKIDSKDAMIVINAAKTKKPIK